MIGYKRKKKDFGFDEGDDLKKIKKSKQLQLFFSVFRLSACTFGGGFVIVPLMKKRFVEELGWLDEQEMLDIAAIAQSSPGAVAVNASILVGYRVSGVSGALLAVGGTVIPPLVIISVISMFYQAFRDNAIVSLVMAGLLCGVAAVIFDVVFDMLKPILQKKQLLPILVFAGAFVAIRYFDVNMILIIFLCGVIGALETLYDGKRKKEL